MLSSLIKTERRSVSKKRGGRADSPFETLHEKLGDLVNISLSHLSESDKEAVKAKAETIASYKQDIQAVLAPLASGRVPQQPIRFENLESEQAVLLNILKENKEGKKFEQQVLQILEKHAAFEKHLQLSLSETIEILEEQLLQFINEEREKQEKEAQVANERISSSLNNRQKELEALQFKVKEKDKVIEDLTRNATEREESDKYKIKTLKKELANSIKTQEDLQAHVETLEKYNQSFEAEKQGHQAIQRAQSGKVAQLQNEVENLSKELEERLTQLNDARVDLEKERSVRKQEKEEFTAARTDLETQLLEAKRDLETRIAAPIGGLDTSNVSEDYGKPIETPRVRFSRRLSLSNEMSGENESVNLGETVGLGEDTPIRPLNRLETHPNLNDNSEPSAGQSVFLKHLGELVSREDRKNIPIFKGDGEHYVSDWLREAERTARSNEWDDSQKIKFFADRLRGEAYEWHSDYVENNTSPLNYQIWKDELKARFTDEADRERLRTKLNNLRQRADQRVKAYIGRINQLYDSVYGREPQSPNEETGRAARNYWEEIRKYRSEAKRKILLAGLLPKIKDELWPRLPKDADYEKICECAVLAESVVISKELSDMPDSEKLNAVLTGIQNREKEHTEEIVKLKKQIEELTEKLTATATSSVNAISNTYRGSTFRRGSGQRFNRGRGRGGSERGGHAPSRQFNSNLTHTNQRNANQGNLNGLQDPNGPGAPVCYKCHQQGHIAKGCRQTNNRPQQFSA